MAANLRIQSPVPAASAGGGPAALAAARVARAGAFLGALGLGASLFVIFRLAETWRVTSGSSTRAFSILGEQLTYPTANLAAVVVIVLAALGLVVAARMVAGAGRELIASRRLCRRLVRDAREIDGVLVIADESPRAFCAGLFTPRVYVSRGAIELLDELALAAVLAHERHHARRRDPLRLAAGRVIAGALFFIPGIGEVVRCQSTLLELGADESAISAKPEHRSGLARAMLGFAERSRPDDPAGIDPERIEHLLGDAATWHFPLLVCLFAGFVLASLVGVGLLAGDVANGSSTLALPLLSRRPCVVMLAATPALVGLLAVALRRAELPITSR